MSSAEESDYASRPAPLPPPVASEEREFAEPIKSPKELQLEVFQDEFVAEMLVLDIIDDIVDAGAQQLYSNYLRFKIIPYASRRALNDVMSVVRWSTLHRDRGDGPGVEPGHVYKSECEPVAPTIDTWARGTIPVRKRPQSRFRALDDPLSKARPPASESGTSTRTRRKPRPKRVEEPSPVPSRRRKAPLVVSAEKPAPRRRRRVRRITATAGGGPGGPGGPGGDGSKAGGGKPTEAERARAQALREIEQRETAERERRERLRAEEEAEAERYDRISRDMKGKDYTFDRNGQVIAIAPVNPEKLPPYAYTLQVAIVDPNAADAAAAEPAPGSAAARRAAAAAASAAASGGGRDGMRRTSRMGGDSSGRGRGGSSGGVDSARGDGRRRGGKRGGGGGGGGGSQPRTRKGRSAQEEDEFFCNSGGFQPPLLSSIVLQGGVVAREGENVLQGPRQHDDPKHMSRKEFSHHQSQLETGTAMDDEVAAAASLSNQLQSPAKGGSDRRALQPGVPLTVTGGGAVVGAPPVAAADASGAASPASGAATPTTATTVTAAAAAAAAAAAGGGAAAAALLRGSGGGGGVSGMSGDPNLMLISDPEWGQNPPRQQQGYAPLAPPQKPSAERQRRVLGAPARAPRDRPYVSTSSPPRRMAAPTYPAYLGHGSDALESPPAGSLSPPHSLIMPRRPHTAATLGPASTGSQSHRSNLSISASPHYPRQMATAEPRRRNHNRRPHSSSSQRSRDSSGSGSGSGGVRLPPGSRGGGSGSRRQSIRRKPQRGGASAAHRGGGGGGGRYARYFQPRTELHAGSVRVNQADLRKLL